MKKYIPIIISILLFIAFHSCRQEDSFEENYQNSLLPNRNTRETISKTDSITKETDPPVKDGQDWKLTN